jgi:two-component system response regulator YesN
MFKVVIADDEYYILREFEHIIDWAAYGCSIVGLAKNGSDAKDLFIKHNAHILITDIKMPIIDGLQLIKELSDIERHIEFILISGFSDFSFALTAIKYGVSDYLLKPIIPEELQSALIKIIGRFKQFDFHESPNRKLQLQSNCNRFIKKAYEYVENHYQNPISLHEVAEYLGISQSYLSKLFVCKLKMRFTQFVNLYRIRISQQYLKATDKTIEDIAELVGYSDYKYYSVVFKSITGMTPIQFKHEKNYFVNS